MDWIGATARTALPICLALLLWAAPQDAWAGACKEAGRRSGCVESKDIARESLRAVDIKNESQGFFALGSDASNIPVTPASYAQVAINPPVDGFVVITVSANISAGSNSTNNIDAKGDVFCGIRIGRRFSRSKFIIGSTFKGSASRKFQPFVSIAWSVGHEVAGGKSRTIFLTCQRIAGTELSISRPAMTVVFHPVEY